ncbi:MAG: uridine kinase [Marmoricola sp.]|jgi:uridine kinase|nr:uridine kinase [Marmoricola sp.]
MVARVVVLAGPSGSGKSRLAEKSGLPVLRLDDFYKDGDDPTLPCIDLAGGSPIVDWDAPESWLAVDAVAAIASLCENGQADVPGYDIARSARTEHHALRLDGAHFFIAEGIFAQEIVAECRARGLLADAICVTQRPVVTFWRRLTRDLREHRKPPPVLVRRGLHLMLQQRAVVAHAVALGCRVASPEQAERAIRTVTTG